MTLTVLTKLKTESTIEWEAPPMVEPTTQQSATIDRLATLHGGVRVKMTVRDGHPFAYVRERWGARYEVPAHGMPKRLLNNDMSAYDEEDSA